MAAQGDASFGDYSKLDENNNLGVVTSDHYDYPKLSDPFSVRKWYQLLWRRQTITVVGCVVLSIMCGAPNAFFRVRERLQEDQGMPAWQLNLVASFGMLGLYFTIPAGLILDRFGAPITIAIGSVMSVVGYICMAFTGAKTWYLMWGCFTLAGFGQGAVFIAAMGASMKALPDAPGTGVAAAGSAMSLSIAWSVFWVDRYDEWADCDSPDCWRDALLVWAIGCMVLYFIGFNMVFFGTPAQLTNEERVALDPHMNDMTDDSVINGDTWEEAPKSEGVTLVQSLNILTDMFFWALFLAYFCGIGYGLLVINSLFPIWFGVSGNYDWVSTITFLFSIANGTAGLLSGTITDTLVSKRFASRATCIAAYLLVASVWCAIVGTALSLSAESTFRQVIVAFILIMVGFFWGCAFVLFPTIVGESWDPQNFGIYFGYLQFASAGAALIIPWFSQGLVYIGDYWLVFWSFAPLMAVAACVLFIAGRRRNRKVTMSLSYEEAPMVY